MPISESQKKATYKYREKYDELRFQVPKGEKETVREHAEKHGESVNRFLQRAVRETMARDNDSLENYKSNIENEVKKM